MEYNWFFSGCMASLGYSTRNVNRQMMNHEVWLRPTLSLDRVEDQKTRWFAGRKCTGETSSHSVALQMREY